MVNKQRAIDTAIESLKLVSHEIEFGESVLLITGINMHGNKIKARNMIVGNRIGIHSAMLNFAEKDSDFAEILLKVAEELLNPKNENPGEKLFKSLISALEGLKK